MSIAEQLKNTDLFKEVELLDLEALVTRMEAYQFDQGHTLFYEGDNGDTMYIIQKGRIRIYMRGKEGEDIILTHYGQNEIFGELSPIDQRPRSASAMAEEDLEVLALDRANFLSFLEERPQIGLAMMRSLSQRLRNTTTFIEEYRPAKEGVVVPATVPHIFRRAGARGGAASELFDRLIKDEEQGQPILDLPEAVEVPYKANSALPDTQTSTETQRIARMGIFDRIAAPLQERLDKEKKE
jgi:CRP-like cAMP-binding protein